MKKKSNENSEIRPYKATVKVMGKTYEAVGETISEAISGLKPKNCKGKSILIVERGEVRKERIFMPSVTYRLFNTIGLSKELALKNASTLFQGI